MMGLRTGAALVVDNDPRDGAAVVQALSKMGVAATYFSGRPEDLPESKLTGIRLAVLDMDLTGGYTGGDGKEALSPVFRVLEAVISPANGPYLTLLWTAHPELAKSFEEMGAHLPGGSVPLLVKTIAKKDVQDRDGFQLRLIADAIQSAAEGLWPLPVLLYWEQVARESAVSVTGALGQLAINPGGEADSAGGSLEQRRRMWAERLPAILHSLIGSSGGASTDKATALELLLETLAALNDDHLEQLCRHSLPGSDILVDRLKAGPSHQLLETEEALINRVLLFSEPDPKITRPWPGNVYDLKAVADGGNIGHLPVSHDGLLRDMLLPARLGPLGSPSTEYPGLVSSSTPVLVEITPICDAAQKSLTVSRLIAGLMFPESRVETLKVEDTAFAWRSEPFARGPIKGGGDVRSRLLLDAHYVFGLDSDELAKIRPILRLRTGVVVDVQSWFARHASRPGHISAWKGKKSTKAPGTSTAPHAAAAQASPAPEAETRSPPAPLGG